jgi:hypothetical protein
LRFPVESLEEALGEGTVTGQRTRLALDATDHRVRKIQRPETDIRPDSPGKYCNAENVPGLGFEIKTDAEDRGLCDVTLALEIH